MSNEQDTMKLIAEVVDKFSGPLKDLTNALKEVNKGAKASHAEAAKATRAHHEEVKKLNERFNKAGETLVTVLSPALAGVGLAAFSVHSAYEKIVDSLAKAGEKYVLFNDTARRSGMNISSINSQTKAFQSLGASVEEAHAAVTAMAATADKLKRGDPAETARWLNSGLIPGQAEKIIEQLKSKTKEEGQKYLQEIMKGEKFQNLPTDKKLRVGGLFGAPPSYSLATREQMEEAEETGRALEKSNPADPERWQKLHDALDHAKDAAEGLEGALVNTFGDFGVGAINKYTESIDKLNEVIRKLKLPDWLVSWETLKNLAPTPDQLKGGGPVLPNGKRAYEDLGDQIRDGFIAAWKLLGSSGLNFSMPPGGNYQPMAYHPNGGGGGSRMRGGYFGNRDFPAKDDDGSAADGNAGGGAAGGGAGGGATGGSAAGGGGAGSRSTAGGGGSGEFKSSTMAGINAAAIAQLRREGVPEKNLAHAAALLTGQAIAESGLKSQYHDGGNIKSIYGADRPRSAAMVKWLKAQGLDPNNPADQMKYMAHSVFAGEPGHNFTPSKNALMNASPETFAQGAFTLGKNFESPAIHNYQRRLKDSLTAFKAGSGAAPLPAASATRDIGDAPSFNDRWDTRVKRGEPTFDQRWDDRVPRDLLENGKRSGLMGGEHGGNSTNHKLSIDFNNMPKGTKTAFQEGGLFKEVKMNRGSAMGMASQDA